MDEVNDNIDGSSGSDMIEEEILVESEQQVIPCTREKNISSMMEIQWVPEKRAREDSEEIIEDDDGFRIVRKGNKKLDRRLSRNSDRSVTGEENLKSQVNVVSVTGKEKILPKQFGLAKLLRAENIINVSKIQYKNAYKAILEFEDRENAEKLIKCQKFLSLGYRCQFVDEVNLSYGVVKQIDLDIDLEEIQQSLKCEYEVVTVRRLKRLSISREWVDSETIRLCFKSSTLPPYVSMYGCRFKVEPYMFPVTQCSGCWRFGHLIKSCPTKIIRCPKCGRNHNNCDTTDFKCLNCKRSHMALDKSCPLFIKEKEIRRIMCKKNCTYRKALSTYLEGKNPQIGHQNIEESTCSTSNIIRNQKPSYRDILTQYQTDNHITERDRQIVNYEDRGEQSMEESFDSPILGKHSKKQNKRNEKSDQSRNVTLSDYEEELFIQQERIENTEDLGKGKVEFKRLLQKLKEVCLSKCSFEVKVKLVCKFIFEECFQFIWKLIKDGDVLSKIMSMFKDGLFT